MNKTLPPKFSVIVLAFQVKPYLQECLDSILCQSYQNYEVILVNPHSSDGTDEICMDYARRFTQVRRLCAENRGQLLNRISGFEAAVGDYLICVDGDDLWKPELLQTLADRLTKTPADVAIFGHRRFRGEEELARVEHTFPDGAMYCTEEEKQPVYDRLFMGGPINEMWAKVIAKDTFLRIDEDFEKLSNVRVAEDWLYSFYVVHAAQSVLYIDAVLYEYRIRPGSIIRTFRTSELEERLKVYSQFFILLERYGMETDENYDHLCSTIARSMADWIFRCSVAHISVSEKKREFEVLKKSEFFDMISYELRHGTTGTAYPMFAKLFLVNYNVLEAYSLLFRVLRKIHRILLSLRK